MLRFMLMTALAGTIVLVLARGYAFVLARSHVISDAARVPKTRVAIVFGAGLTRTGTPTAMLQDRVASAADLYAQGIVQKLLMSGDNSIDTYDEPSAMKRAAMEMGVPESDIVLDFAGRSTYDTCYRARDIFGLTDAVLITQAFHLDRALMICHALGMNANGFMADRRPYARISFNWLRELPATAKAAWDVFIAHPKPILGDKIRI